MRWELKFYPYKKGDGKSFSHAQGAGGGGGTTFFRVTLTHELEILSHERGRGTKVSTLLKVSAKGFIPTISPFCSLPTPPRN